MFITLGEIVSKGNGTLSSSKNKVKGDTKVSFESYLEKFEICDSKLNFIFRDGIEKIYGYNCKTDKHFDIPIESFILVIGVLETNNTDSTSPLLRDSTVPSLTIKVENIEVISRCKHKLKKGLGEIFDLAEKEEASNSGNLATRYEQILKNRDKDSDRSKRFLSLRLIENQAIFAIKSKLRNLFENFLVENDFIQIEIPKLLPYLQVTEDQSFRVDYFGREVYLSQHESIPMLLCVQGGMDKTFRVDDNFRAEKRVSNRHLTQFTVVTFCMRLHVEGSERELYEFAWKMLSSVFESASKACVRELEVLRKRFGESVGKVSIGEKPVVMKYGEALGLVNERRSLKVGTNTNCVGGVAGKPSGLLELGDDFSAEDEHVLGEVVKEKFGSDVFVITEYPYKLRDFGCKVIEGRGEEGEGGSGNPNVQQTYSFDILMKGQEISSAVEYENNLERLRKVAGDRNESALNEGFKKSVAEGFGYGMPRCGALGIGLDRIVRLFLGLEDIKSVVLFPRDYSSICP